VNIGIFAVDPGGATGLAWAIVDASLPNIEDCLLNRAMAGSITVDGDARKQFLEIAQLWESFSRACRDKGIVGKYIFPVCEDFVYTPGVNYEGDSARISTQIIWGFEGYRWGRAYGARGIRAKVPDLYLQTASQAKGYVTKERLKEWDLWVVGRDHERSANQHLAYFLAQFRKHNS
jgi:hypothetical protein